LLPGRAIGWLFHKTRAQAFFHAHLIGGLER
jgi:hypothetical protein